MATYPSPDEPPGDRYRLSGDSPAGDGPVGDGPATDGPIGGGGGRRLSRRRVLQAVGVAGVVGAGGAAWALSQRGSDPLAADLDGIPAVAGLDDLADAVRAGGPGPDGIPPIDEPRYLSAPEVDFLEPDDVVFGLIIDGQPRAYPQLILVWHEIVNDESAEGPMSVTYCPLTGSAVGFRPHGGIVELGTSGSLVNSNLLMYDRSFESTWPQILAQAITGPRRGETLAEFPVEWTTWQRWRTAFPQTEVLSVETGYVRSYGRDPYGNYNPVGGYYALGSGRMFPVLAEDDRFDPKDVFLGAKLGDARLAVHKERALAEPVIMSELDGTPVVFLHDPELATSRAFVAGDAGEPLDLVPADAPGQYRDQSSGAVWDSWGRPVAGENGTELTRILTYDVMWFAWFAFFPNTQVIA